MQKALRAGSLTSSDFDGDCSYSNIVQDAAKLTLVNCSSVSDDIPFDLTLIRELLFTDHLAALTSDKRLSTLPVDTSMFRSQGPTILSCHSVDCCRSSCSCPVAVSALTRDGERSLNEPGDNDRPMALEGLNERVSSQLDRT